MTVNYAFEFDDDDFFSDVLKNISDNDLIHSSSTSSSSNILHNSVIMPDTNIENKTDFKKNDSNLEFKSHERCLSKKDMKSETLLFEHHLLPRTINSRFTSELTPKPKKRKFPGPAGLFTQEEEPKLFKSNIIAEDETVQSSPNSQNCRDVSSHPSWQKLQSDVSNNEELYSVVRFQSIERILYEASGKKLPKHVEAPMICVLIKSIDIDESPVFMDDTGEIKGKIGEEVLDEFGIFLKVGTSLILRKVTVLCNVLLLQKQSVVSIYLSDGTIQQIQDINPFINNSESPLQSISRLSSTPNICGIQKVPRVANASPSLKKSDIDSYSSEAETKSTDDQELLTECLNSTGIQRVPRVANASPSLKKSDIDSYSSEAETKSTDGQELLTECPQEDFELDDFDEIICSLDEKSFTDTR